MALRKTVNELLRTYVRKNCAQIVASSSTDCTDNSSKSIPKYRFVQFQRAYDKKKRLGVVSQDGSSLIDLSSATCISTDMIGFLQQDISMAEVDEKLQNLRTEKISDNIVLLPPITNPGKIICMGMNYKDHCTEQKKPVPTEPIFFSKFSNTLVGPTGFIKPPCCAKRLDYEVELAVIIGKMGRFIPVDKAMDHVFGYSIAQDITARDWQKRNGGQFLIGKSMDTFCPFGPALVHKSIIPDVNNLKLVTCVNGKEKQNGNTSEMIFKIDDVVSRLSDFMTLCPGDIILTGTPKGVGMYRNPPEYLKPGDVIESHIELIGKLCNKVLEPKK